MKVLIVLACFFVFSRASRYGDFEIGKYGDGVSTSEVQECHGVPCPAGTIGCSKVTKTSTDTKTLMVTIQCEDMQGNVLNSATKTSENKYAGTHISSFSFTGQYSYNGGQHINLQPSIPKVNNHFHKDYNNYNLDKVETFE